MIVPYHWDCRVVICPSRNMQSFPERSLKSLIQQVSVSLMHQGMTVVQTVEEMLGLMEEESQLNFIPVGMWKSVLGRNPMEPTTYVVADTVTNSALLCLYTPRRPFKMPIDFHPRELTPAEIRLISRYGAFDEVAGDHRCVGCKTVMTPDDSAPRCPHCELPFCSPTCYLEGIRAHVKGGCSMHHCVFAKYFVGVRCIEHEPMPLVPSPTVLLMTPYCVRTVPRDWGTEFYFIDPETLRHFVVLTSNMEPEMAKAMLGYKGNFSHPTRVEMDFLETVNFATMDLKLAGLSRAAQKQSIWIYRAKNFEYIRTYKVRQAMGAWKSGNHASALLCERKSRQDRQITGYLFSRLRRALQTEAQRVAAQSSKYHQSCLSIAISSFRRGLQYAQTSARMAKLAHLVPNHQHRLSLCLRTFRNRCIVGKSARQRIQAFSKRTDAHYSAVAARKAFYRLRTKPIVRRAFEASRKQFAQRQHQRLLSAFAGFVTNLAFYRRYIQAIAAATTAWNVKSLRHCLVRWKKIVVFSLKAGETRLLNRVARLESKLEEANARAAEAERQLQLSEARHHEEKVKYWNMTTNAQLEVDAYKRRMDACKRYYMSCLQDAQTNMTHMFGERMEVAQKM